MSDTTEVRQERTLRQDIYLAVGVYLIASVVFFALSFYVSPL